MVSSRMDKRSRTVAFGVQIAVCGVLLAHLLADPSASNFFEVAADAERGAKGGGIVAIEPSWETGLCLFSFVLGPWVGAMAGIVEQREQLTYSMLCAIFGAFIFALLNGLDVTLAPDPSGYKPGSIDAVVEFVFGVGLSVVILGPLMTPLALVGTMIGRALTGQKG